eukprot:12833108-Ditylum_brightwellii.AAC.1
MGLEGTGHHLMQAILKASPDIKRLKELGLVPDKTLPIEQALYHQHNLSLFTAWKDQGNKQEPI